MSTQTATAPEATDAPEATPATAAAAQADEDAIELSVVIPCLNEHETIAIVVEKAVRAIREHGIAGEVIVADNGSEDGSQQLARDAGATVIPVERRGYGNALKGGIAVARGKYVIMGDADDSYDMLEIPRFVEQLRAGHELVQGCRLPGGGGTVMPGAMPWLHRWFGNPVLTQLVRLFFRAPIHDVYCGLRGFTADLYDRLQLRSGGMEFATEMIIKASAFRADIAEVPITLHPDGRKIGRPHLRTFRDGWRTLRLFLQFSPRWTFGIPGVALLSAGLLGYALALPGVRIGPAVLDVHTLLVASLALLLGNQLLAMGIFARRFADEEGLLPSRPWLDALGRWFPLERVLVLSGLVMLAGVALVGRVALQWAGAGFGALDYPTTLRWVIPGVTLVALGANTVFSALFTSLLRLRQPD